MYIHVTKPLFAWDCLEDSPSLRTLREFLQVVPDGRLLEALRHARGRGRNDYPVHVLWGTVLLTIVLRHTGFEACIGELKRNAALRRLIGIETEHEVPKKWNVSRFLRVLGQEPHLTLLREVFDQMVKRLGETVPDIGAHTAGDATGLSAQRRRAAACSTGEAHLPEAEGGHKEYTDETGKVVKVIKWFGYKLHQIVDTRHEVALAYSVSSTKAGDNDILPDLLDEAQANLPEGRIQTLTYDKAADDGKVHRRLRKSRIKPAIKNRAMWKGDPERMLPGHDGRSNVVYDEAGTVYCYDVVSSPPVRRAMAYIGHEASRGTLKYRCPARHRGEPCPSDVRCNRAKPYGKTVRVKCEIHLRRFPPIPRATKQFERLYRGRTAVERVNARLKVFWGADDGNITGAARFHAFVGCVMVVHLGLATLLASAPRREGTLGKMRLSPIAKAMCEKWKA